MDWLRQLPIGQFIIGSTSWLRYLDPRLKLSWTIIFLTTPIMSGPLWRIGIMIALIIVTVISGLRWRSWYRNVATLLAFSILAGVLTTLLPSTTVPATASVRPYNEFEIESYLRKRNRFPPKLVLIRWGLNDWKPHNKDTVLPNALTITRYSLDLGINTTTLLFTLLHSANLLLMSTPPEELIWSLTWFLMPLRIIGIPSERLGFMLLLSLRFVPLVQEEIQNLFRSASTRAINLRQLGLKGTLELMLTITERLLINVLLRADQGAEALLARGGYWLSPIHFQPNTRVNTKVNTICLAALIITLLIRGKYGAF